MTSVAVHLRLNEKLAKRIDDLVKQEGYRSRQELIEYALARRPDDQPPGVCVRQPRDGGRLAGEAGGAQGGRVVDLPDPGDLAVLDGEGDFAS